MRTSIYSLAIVAAALMAAPVRADDDAKKIIQDAVKAHGGAEVLAKHHGKAAIQKGKMHISVGGQDIDGTMEVSTDSSRFRRNAKLSVMGMDVTQTTVFDGKEFWVVTNDVVGMTLDKKEDIDRIKESLYGEQAVSNVLNGDAGYKLAVIGDDKVDDTPIVGVRISKEGHKDVSVYFDKGTHLIRKVVSQGLDPQLMEVETTRILDGYKEFDGQKRATKAVVLQNGAKLAEIEFTDIKIVDKLDDDLFTKPK